MEKFWIALHSFSLYLLFGSLIHFAFLYFYIWFLQWSYTLIFILFIALNFNVYIKVTCIIGIFINFLIPFFIIFLRIFFRIFYFLTFGCFFPLVIKLLLCDFDDILHVSCLFFTNSNNSNLSSGPVFSVFILVLTKMLTAFKVIITALWMIHGYFLQPCLFFLKVRFNNRSNIKLRPLVILIAPVLPFLHKHIKIPDHNEAIRRCGKH